jgi:hypothetical protein
MSFEGDPDPDVQFMSFVAAAEKNTAEADARDAAVRAKAQTDAEVFSKTNKKEIERYKSNAEKRPNCEEIRRAYFYEKQSPQIQLVIDRFIDTQKSVPPFQGDFVKAEQAAKKWQQMLKTGGYKSKLKSKKYRYNKKSKTNKRRRSRSRRYHSGGGKK